MFSLELNNNKKDIYDKKISFKNITNILLKHNVSKIASLFEMFNMTSRSIIFNKN